ncbi:MAG: Ig-like domain-containing protein [Thalassotalea sp.]|nr:Ig-like domain-containing protein [Thalassotalea sp.]
MELFRRLSFAMVLLTLVGCGGGDGGLSNGNTPDPGGNDNDFALSISISTTDVSSQNPATVSATLTNNGSPAAGQVVNFNTTLGVLSPNSGTALTGDDGVATITLTAGDVKGAGTVTATYGEATASVSFNSQGDDSGNVGDINITLQLVDSDGNAADTITASKPGKVVANVNGITSPVIVSFESTVGDIPIATAITDENNQATIDILAGGTLGAGRVTASLDTGESGEVLLVVGASNVIMGSGDPFQAGVADVSLAQISAGGTTVVSVRIVDDEGNLFTESVDVNFSSACTSASTPSASLSTPVTTSSGIATSTYLAEGCVGDDNISVNANAGGINLSAAAVVNVLAADVGSIEFVSATPENISILGTGSSESSTVLFRVLDTNGNPVNNQAVNFSLNTNTGGIQTIPMSATTNVEGLVQTVVNSGTVATTIRVKAAIDGSDPEIATQSSRLVVSTGIPDQDSMSLSASVLNPEAWSYDGDELAGVDMTIRMADAFNNPVPDGTAVNFTTEGGSIDPSCVTENGACTVKWRGQFPRPEGEVLNPTTCLYVGTTSTVSIATGCADWRNTMGQRFGGRATVLATAIGEESFPDLNGNGRFDATEVDSFVGGTDLSGRPFDLKEAFVDHNEDGFYNPAESGGDDTNGGGDQEEFVDFNNDASFTLNDNLYNGVLCSEPTHGGCAVTEQSLNVRDSLVLVMSGSSPYATYLSPDFDGNFRIQVAVKGAASLEAVIADLHNQPMPAGTIISMTVDGEASLIGESTYTVPSTNHNGGIVYPAFISGGDESGTAVLTISVETPNGVQTALPRVDIDVN